jgi:hypothetical protein
MELLYANCKLLHGSRYDKKLILLYHVWLRLGQRRMAKWVLNHQLPNAYTCNEFVGTTGTGYKDLTLKPDLVDELKGFDTSWTPELIMQAFLGMPTMVWVGGV